jgi:hypothetical protein
MVMLHFASIAAVATAVTSMLKRLMEKKPSVKSEDELSSCS